MNAKATDTKRTFTFDAAFSIPVPTTATAITRSNSLPFKEKFSEVQGAALEGKQPHFFVPHAYWTEEREVAAEKVTGGYVRSKLRGQFNDWQKQDITRAPLKLIILERTGKEEGFKEPGVSFWITKPAA